LSAAAVAGEVSLNIAAADVPAALISSTSNAALLYAAGQAAGGIVSSHVIALAEGVIKTMILTKFKTMTVAVLVLGATALGGGHFMTGPSVAAPHGDKPLAAIDEKLVGRAAQPPQPATTWATDFQSRFEPMKAKLLELGGGSKESEYAVALGLAWLARYQENDGRWK